eukprot:TRINITY_DN51553_c0_g1_i1.p1 TRINITY_DN51553_c0_g1~~TRINITY_DN51553_c0_g1_i1.p1  ORF type:complete len:116 (+),score=8.82 TRINITY_DN51553_c0_g1_i1:33-350(+)
MVSFSNSSERPRAEPAARAIPPRDSRAANPFDVRCPADPSLSTAHRLRQRQPHRTPATSEKSPTAALSAAKRDGSHQQSVSTTNSATGQVPPETTTDVVSLPGFH